MQALGATFITPPAHQGPATARCFVLVTPDAQRSMNTYLGASVGFSPSDLDPALIKAAQITYLEGYLFDKPEAQLAFLEALRIASHAERKLALTLSDTFCVERHKPAFRNLIKSGVDIVFANQNELLALTETTEIQQAVATMQDSCPLLVTTLGEQGAIICARGQSPIKIAAAPVTTLVDSTGAGDQFAAGFLYGLTHGHEHWLPPRLSAILDRVRNNPWHNWPNISSRLNILTLKSPVPAMERGFFIQHMLSAQRVIRQTHHLFHHSGRLRNTVHFYHPNFRHYRTIAPRFYQS